MIDQRFETFKNQSRDLASAFRECSLLAPSPILGDYFLKRAEHVYNCGSYLEFDKITNDLVYAFFCRDRLCPMCSWRKSIKLFSHLSKILDLLPDNQRYIFITLTVRNCDSKDLSRVLDSMLSGWEYFYKGSDKRSPLPVLGCFRNLEITINPLDFTCHPHIHCLCPVSDDYDKDISQNDICLRWQNALKLDYKPICDIRYVNNDPDRSFLPEVTKYVCKCSDFLKSCDSELVYNVALALRNRRLYSFNGILWKLNKDLNGIDLESVELTDRAAVRNDVIDAFIFDGSFYRPSRKIIHSRTFVPELDFKDQIRLYIQ